VEGRALRRGPRTRITFALPCPSLVQQLTEFPEHDALSNRWRMVVGRRVLGPSTCNECFCNVERMIDVWKSVGELRGVLEGHHCGEQAAGDFELGVLLHVGALKSK